MNTTNYMKKQLNAAFNDLADFAKNCDRGGLLDYLKNDVLDVEVKTDAEGRFIGCKIELAAGGPTTWADTQNKILTTTWNGGEISRELSTEICDFINNVTLEYVF